MSKQVIGVFSLAYEPFVGGAEIAVKEIIRRSDSWDFVILTNKFDRSWPVIEVDQNCTVVRIGAGVSGKSYYGGFLGKLAYAFKAYRRAEAIHRKQPFAATWAVMASYAGLAALIFKFRHPTVPMLLTLQEGDSEGHILRKVGIFYPIWKKLFQKADQIQAISNYLADFARRHGAGGPVEVVPNGVDTDLFSGGKVKSVSRGAIKKIVTTSRLVPKNGVDTLIRALAVLKDRSGYDDIRLSIAGLGPEEDSLKDLAAKLGVNKKVEFLGQVSQSAMPELFSGADIFVRPSRSEGLGNSFLEAMAAGLPVVGTPVGGIPDFLKDGETGLFCRVDDPEDLADQIIRISEDPELYRKVAEAGQKLAREWYSWEVVAKKMDLIFKKLCA